MQDDQADPCKEDVGIFLTNETLHDWNRKIQKKCPEVFTPDVKIFGQNSGQHPFDTKLLAYFDDDPNKPMRCVVKGSRWVLEPKYPGVNSMCADSRESNYIVLINGELTQIALTSAHEEGGWKIETIA